jgi:hypothetical protein
VVPRPIVLDSSARLARRRSRAAVR